jgi:hypothetical protein
VRPACLQPAIFTWVKRKHGHKEILREIVALILLYSNRNVGATSRPIYPAGSQTDFHKSQLAPCLLEPRHAMQVASMAVGKVVRKEIA